MEKDTTKILEELKGCASFSKFYKENGEYVVDKALSEYLSELAEKKGLTRSEIIKKADISEIYGYQIFSGVRTQQRNKLLCIAFGMGLDLDETQKLLKCTGYPALYAKKPFDSIVIYGICKGMTVMQVNELLFEWGQETLG